MAGGSGRECGVLRAGARGEGVHFVYEGGEADAEGGKGDGAAEADAGCVCGGGGGVVSAVGVKPGRRGEFNCV